MTTLKNVECSLHTTSTTESLKTCLCACVCARVLCLTSKVIRLCNMRKGIMSQSDFWFKNNNSDHSYNAVASVEVVSDWDASEKACDRLGSVRQCDVLSFDINKRLPSKDTCENSEVAVGCQGQTRDQRSWAAENCKRVGTAGGREEVEGGREDGRTPGAADAGEAGEKRLSRRCVFISWQQVDKGDRHKQWHRSLCRWRYKKNGTKRRRPRNAQSNNEWWHAREKGPAQRVQSVMMVTRNLIHCHHQWWGGGGAHSIVDTQGNTETNMQSLHVLWAQFGHRTKNLFKYFCHKCFLLILKLWQSDWD